MACGFRVHNLSFASLKGWKESQLPPCTNEPAQGKGTVNGTQFEHGPLIYGYCKIILDSVPTMAVLSPQLAIADVIFDHRDVFYNGGPIVIFSMRVGTNPGAPIRGNIYFTDCLFVFSIPTPPVDGQELTKAVLAASGTTIHLQLTQS
jgi:hypothetical protein